MNIAEFVSAAIEQRGGMVEARAPQIVDALLPPELQEIAGGRALVSLALEADALQREPDAELATVGSPFVDNLLDFVAGHGATSAGHLPVERPRTKGLYEEAQRELLFSHCRVRTDDAPPEVKLVGIAQFNFKVTFFSDERRERLFVVPVNLWSNTVNLDLAAILDELRVESQAPRELGRVSQIALPDAYATARAALAQLVDEETERHQSRLRKRFEVEYGRLRDYYAQVTRELTARRAREDDAKRGATLDAKLEAAGRERERKLREVGENHRLRRRAKLTSARLLTQPKTFFNLHLDRSRETRTLALAYDSLLERLEWPLCDNCRQPTPKLNMTPDAKLLCPVCEK